MIFLKGLAMYKIEFTRQAIEDAIFLRKNEPSAYKKLVLIVDELKCHPNTGTGKPERLSGERSNQWSRRINKKYRIVYTIQNDVLIVLVLLARGHYEDK